MAVKNLMSMTDLSLADIYKLIDRALALKSGAKVDKRPDVFVSNLFFENSTRTKHSFEVAERHLNLELINFETDNSSIAKGESLYDTCKTLEMIGCQILVIRHGQENYDRELKGLTIPIINGGDGSGEHPSQSLLDLMTIYEHFGRFEGLKVAIVGDIRHSRVARSNYISLTNLGAEVVFIGPEEFEDTSLGKMVQFDDNLADLDVCMLLRVQHERHSEEGLDQPHSYHQDYGLTQERYDQLKSSAIVMHPAPVNRGVELADQLVEAPKSRIFEQMKNGMFMRQAILEYIMKENNL